MNDNKNSNMLGGLTDEELKSAKAWNDVITGKVSEAVGATLDGDFVAANYTPGFNYMIRQVNYNADSLAALNTRLEAADGVPVLGDVYTTLYKNVIDNLEYGYSTGDQQKMNDEAAKLSAMTGSVIDQFMTTDLYDPSQDDVTISYIMQRIVEVKGKDYTDLDTIKYPQYTVLCNMLSDYARAATFTSQLQMRWYEAYQRLQAASANVGSPSKDNGALKVDDGSYVCAWGRLPEPEQLLSALQGGSSVSFSVEASDFKSEESNFRFESDVSCRVPFMWFLSVFDVNHTHEYELNKYADEGASLTITVEYKDITQVPAVPQPLSDDNKTGWFASDVLEEAAVNSGRDETGYRLNGGEFDPDELFGEGGSLRRIKTFVISQRPAITLSFTNFDFSEIEEDFKQGTDVTFKLLGGLISGTHDNDYSFSDYSYNEETRQTTIKIVPGPITGSGASSKQTAFVLGGSVESFSRGKKIRFAQAEPTEEGKKLAADNSGGGELYALYAEDKDGRFVFSGIIDRTKHSGYFKSRAVAVPLESTIGEPEFFSAGTTVYNVIGSSKDKGNWVKVWENAMLSGGYAPNTRQCYVAGSGKIGCTQPGPRSIVGGHVVKNSTETEPKEGADFVYTLPICKAHNYYRNFDAMQTCMAVWALSLKKYLKDVSLVGGYENLLRSLG